MDARVQEINPEFAALLRKVRSIHAVTGGTEAQTKNEKKELSSFDGMRKNIIVRINHLEEMCEVRDSSAMEADSRDHIRLKNQINMELQNIQDDVEKLQQIHVHDVKKRGRKMTREDMLHRKECLDGIAKEFQIAHQLAKGYKRGGANTVAAAAINLEDLEKGEGTLGGGRVQQEEMTGQQRQELAQIHREMEDQDDLLDQIQEGVGTLKEMAVGIQDELKEQNTMLEDVDTKMDKVSTKLDNVNDRMKKTLKIVQSNSSNFCAYSVCCIILLGLLTIIYNMIK